MWCPFAVRTFIEIDQFRTYTPIRWRDQFAHHQKKTTMPTGTVKWFNTTKDYGFIEPQDGAADVFVNISAVEQAGLGTLREGQQVSFATRPDRDGRLSADERPLVREPREHGARAAVDHASPYEATTRRSERTPATPERT